MDNTEKIIANVTSTLFLSLSGDVSEKILLCGGAAAYLYGSRRPFSNDIDFLVDPSVIPDLQEAFKITFERFSKKPIFHSTKAPFEIEGVSVDFISESVIQPENIGAEFRFIESPFVQETKKKFTLEGVSIYCISSELLVLMKLLAGRGAEVGKYDLEDIYHVLLNAHDFNYDTFKKLFLEFCRPYSQAIPTLIRHAENLVAEYNGEATQRLLDFLKSDQPAPEIA